MLENYKKTYSAKERFYARLTTIISLICFSISLSYLIVNGSDNGTWGIPFCCILVFSVLTLASQLIAVFFTSNQQHLSPYQHPTLFLYTALYTLAPNRFKKYLLDTNALMEERQAVHLQKYTKRFSEYLQAHSAYADDYIQELVTVHTYYLTLALNGHNDISEHESLLRFFVQQNEFLGLNDAFYKELHSFFPAVTTLLEYEKAYNLACAVSTDKRLDNYTLEPYVKKWQLKRAMYAGLEPVITANYYSPQLEADANTIQDHLNQLSTKFTDTLNNK